MLATVTVVAIEIYLYGSNAIVGDSLNVLHRPMEKLHLAV